MEVKQNLITKPPVVVVLGHIDHGKSSLLLAIREMEVPSGKPGGVITQHIGAYQVEKNNQKITFIDTPGHEAFSQMRSRGAKVADVAILVIDAVEGVQTQTKEAISHIKKAQIPVIVAINKIDKPAAHPEKVKKDLQKEGILVEEFGGKVPVVATSAKTGQGIEELLEIILLLAEMENLKADLSKPAEGVIIEAFLDSKRGPVATLILNQGELKLGDIVVTPSTLGKIKTLEDFQGKKIEKVEPAQPALLIGLEKVPKVGEKIKAFFNIESAREHLQEERRIEGQVLRVNPEQKVLNLILKTDVLGSLEAIDEILKKLPQEKVLLRILKAEVGEINPNDIELAKTGKGVIVGFRTKVNSAAKILAQREKIKILQFEIIYDLIEGVRKLMEKVIEPEIVRMEIGKVKVLVNFWAEKNRQIVGGKVIEGEIKRRSEIEIYREERLVGRGKLVNLQINKKDVEKATRGQECGILYEGEGKIEEGDILHIFIKEQKKTQP